MANAIASTTGLIALLGMALSLPGCGRVVRDQIYRSNAIPATLTWPGAAPQDVQAITKDQLALRGFYWPTQGQNDLIVFFQGRDGNAYNTAIAAQPLTGGGHGLLIASYRGFGNNPGKPTQQGLYDDGAAFIALARRLAPGARIYLLGYSLGAAVALENAARADVNGVVTYGAFTKLSASTGWPGVILPDRYDVLGLMPYVRSSVLILQGGADKDIPAAQAEALAKAGQNTRLVVVPDMGHQPDFTQLAPLIWRNIAAMPYAGRAQPGSSEATPAPDTASQPPQTIDLPPSDAAPTRATQR